MPSSPAADYWPQVNADGRRGRPRRVIPLDRRARALPALGVVGRLGGRSGSVGRAVRPPGAWPLRPAWRGRPAAGGWARLGLRGASDRPPPRLLGHGVLAAELAVHAAACRARRRRIEANTANASAAATAAPPVAAGAATIRAAVSKKCRGTDDRPAPAEYHQHDQDGRGILLAGGRNRPWSASFARCRRGLAVRHCRPFLDLSASAKSQDPASAGRERSVIKASSPAASASPADR